MTLNYRLLNQYSTHFRPRVEHLSGQMFLFWAQRQLKRWDVGRGAGMGFLLRLCDLLRRLAGSSLTAGVKQAP
jgi:hypothetical protein